MRMPSLINSYHGITRNIGQNSKYSKNPNHLMHWLEIKTKLFGSSMLTFTEAGRKLERKDPLLLQVKHLMNDKNIPSSSLIKEFRQPLFPQWIRNYLKIHMRNGTKNMVQVFWF